MREVPRSIRGSGLYFFFFFLILPSIIHIHISLFLTANCPSLWSFSYLIRQARDDAISLPICGVCFLSTKILCPSIVRSTRYEHEVKLSFYSNTYLPT
ncbi:uncharacterized protein BDW43DRAFT_199351 [Aspergillus alliaceus]|uniref:uncharacterized protein n=1 Tax=Petromyces alliaceus TaxID=209559 RepID=UPI0012A52994|nr:uncharacterized protein BDW43DRAFT_199351 [Aspergillus alliaceus]KAB8228925.1 hypothetical protein BDW43DRAFT_199351 [Aspergillus alliaceus]